MKNDLNLTDFLINVLSSFDKKVENSGLVRICVEIPCIDLFQVYELFINKYKFSSFWEESNGISYIAFDKCKYVTLDGPKRFEVAKEFNSEPELITWFLIVHISSISVLNDDLPSTWPLILNQQFSLLLIINIFGKIASKLGTLEDKFLLFKFSEKENK